MMNKNSVGTPSGSPSTTPTSNLNAATISLPSASPTVSQTALPSTSSKSLPAHAPSVSHSVPPRESMSPACCIEKQVAIPIEVDGVNIGLQVDLIKVVAQRGNKIDFDATQLWYKFGLVAVTALVPMIAVSRNRQPAK